MFLLGKMRIPEQMLNWKIFYEFWRDKKEGNMQQSYQSPVSYQYLGRDRCDKVSVKKESGQKGKMCSSTKT